MKKKTNLYTFFILISFLLVILFLKKSASPFNADWLYSHVDLSTYQIGWYFFKNDQWRIPLGLNPNYGVDLKNTIIFSDSIPLLAFFFKFFFKIFKVNNEIIFQYFSLWYFICFFLQLFFSFKIINFLTKNSIFSFLSSIIFLLSPVYLFRISQHSALVGHWLILFTLYLLITDDEFKKRKKWFFLIIISSLIQLYFTYIILISFVIFLLNKFYKKKKIYFIDLFFIIFTFFSLYLVMLFVGYFEIRLIDGIGGGYGDYKLNVLSILDPGYHSNFWSTIMPDIKLSALEENEGFNYFGLGSLILISITLFFFFKNKSKIYFIKKKIIFIIYSIILTALALTNKISIGDLQILNLEINKYIFASLSFFRASGRIFWPVYYLILIFSFFFLYKNLSQKKSIFIIIICLLIQLIDISGAIKKHSDRISQFKINNSEELNYLFKKKKNLISVNNFNNNPNFSQLSFFSERFGIKKTNVINLSRFNREKLAEKRYEIYKNLYNKKIDRDSIYIIDSLSHLRNLQKIFKDNMYFYQVDKFWVMVDPENKLINKNSLSPIDFKIIIPNYNYEFSILSEDNFLGLGWSHNNIKGGIWSDGYIASLLMNVQNLNKSLIFEISCEPYLNNKHQKQNIEIFYNNILIKKINFDFNKKSSNLIKFELKKELITDNNIELKFFFKNPGSPSHYNESPDSKKLGISIKNLIIK